MREIEEGPASTKPSNRSGRRGRLLHFRIQLGYDDPPYSLPEVRDKTSVIEVLAWAVKPLSFPMSARSAELKCRVLSNCYSCGKGRNAGRMPEARPWVDSMQHDAVVWGQEGNLGPSPRKIGEYEEGEEIAKCTTFKLRGQGKTSEHHRIGRIALSLLGLEEVVKLPCERKGSLDSTQTAKEVTQTHIWESRHPSRRASPRPTRASS